MKILVLGANGKLGKFVVDDLLKTKVNKITTLTRKPFTIHGTTNIVGTPMNVKDLEKASKGIDVIISALGASTVDDFRTLYTNAAKVAKENNSLLIWSGGAGTLFDASNIRLIDWPDSAWTEDNDFLKTQVFGQKDALNYLESDEGLKYIYVSPALDLDFNRELKPFEIKATDKVLYNKDGKSQEGYATQAAALVQLIDHHDGLINKRVTVVEK